MILKDQLGSTISLISVIGVDPELYDLNLIHHFVEHYRSLGIVEFNIIVNAETASKIKLGLKIFEDLGIHASSWLGNFNEFGKTFRLRRLQLRSETRWILAVDSDEFVIIKKNELENLIQDLNEKKYSYVKGILVDRVTENRSLKSVDAADSIWAQFPVSENITSDILGGCNRKIFLLDKNICFISHGSHYVLNRARPHSVLNHIKPYPKIYTIGHFKWTKTIQNRIKKRLSWRVNWKIEYSKTLKYIESLESND